MHVASFGGKHSAPNGLMQFANDRQDVDEVRAQVRFALPTSVCKYNRRHTLRFPFEVSASMHESKDTRNSVEDKFEIQSNIGPQHTC
jgi:hypothetical protein